MTVSGKDLILIAGPTASGKSASGARTGRGARRHDHQRRQPADLPRSAHPVGAPDDAAMARVPHRLYGFLDAAERGSVGHWRALALDEIAAAIAPGGCRSSSAAPGFICARCSTGSRRSRRSRPRSARRRRRSIARSAAPRFASGWRALDPVAATAAAARRPPALMRAYEVVRATGRPIGDWQAGHGGSLALPLRDDPARAAARGALRRLRCTFRSAMIEAGALDEARALAARGLDPSLPAMKAVGVPELLRHLRGEIAARRRDRRGAARHPALRQAPDDLVSPSDGPGLVLDAQYSESLLHCSRHFIDRFLLTGRA